MHTINDVALIARKRHEDPRGWLLKVVEGTEPGINLSAGEVYVVSGAPRQTRGGHFHSVASEWFTLIEGDAELVVEDPQSRARRVLTLASSKPVTVFVPPGVAHQFRGTGDASYIVIACASHRYDPADTIPYTFE